MDVIVDAINAFINFLVAPLTFISDALNAIGQAILDFFYNDIYSFVTKAYAEFIKAEMIAEFKFKIAVMSFAWDVAKELLASLQISSFINQAWGSLDSRALQLLTFFRVPEGLNLLISSATTKFVFKFMGFK